MIHAHGARSIYVQSQHEGQPLSRPLVAEPEFDNYDLDIYFIEKKATTCRMSLAFPTEECNNLRISSLWSYMESECNSNPTLARIISRNLEIRYIVCSLVVRYIVVYVSSAFHRLCSRKIFQLFSLTYVLKLTYRTFSEFYNLKQNNVRTRRYPIFVRQQRRLVPQKNL